MPEAFNISGTNTIIASRVMLSLTARSFDRIIRKTFISYVVYVTSIVGTLIIYNRCVG